MVEVLGIHAPWMLVLVVVWISVVFIIKACIPNKVVFVQHRFVNSLAITE